MPLEIKGTGLNRFCAIGKLHFYKRSKNHCTAVLSEGVSRDGTLELSRLEIAFEKTKEECEEYSKASDESKSVLRVLEEQGGLSDLARENIFRGQSAEDAIMNAANELSAQRAKFGDPYLILDTAVIKEVGAQLVSFLGENAPSFEKNEREYRVHPVILVARDIGKEELLGIDRDMLLGIMLTGAKPLSELALIAYAFGIPVIVGEEEGLLKLENESELEDICAVIDAEKGLLLIDPDDEMVEQYAARIAEIAGFASQGESSFRSLGMTVGAEFNFDSKQEVISNEEAGGTDLLCLPSPHLHEDFDENLIYLRLKSILKASKSGEVSIAIEKDNADLKAWLRAILRANDSGRISLALANVVSADDLRHAFGLISEVKNELLKEKISFSDKLSVGAVIMRCAAVIMSAELAELCDFFILDCDSLFLSLFGSEAKGFGAKDIAENSECLIRAAEFLGDAARAAAISMAACGMLASRRRFYARFASLGVKKIFLPISYLKFFG